MCVCQIVLVSPPFAQVGTQWGAQQMVKYWSNTVLQVKPFAQVVFNVRTFVSESLIAEVTIV